MEMLYQREDGDSINLCYDEEDSKPWSILNINSYYTDDGGSSISYDEVERFDRKQKAIDFAIETYYYLEGSYTYKSKLLGGTEWV